MNGKEKSQRILALTCGFCVSIVVIFLFNILPIPPEMAKFLVDRSVDKINLFSCQNAMWILFFIGIADLFIRNMSANSEYEAMSLGLLPEDETTILNSSSLVSYYKKNKVTYEYRLSKIINLVILQFQTTKSVDMSNDVMKTSLEFFSNEIEEKYTFLRYIVWAIPSFGFIGTVYGISMALNTIKSMSINDPNLLSKTVSELSVAFYTTLLALLMSCLLVFFMGIIQSKEERILNETGKYCLKNLINRLYLKQ